MDTKLGDVHMMDHFIILKDHVFEAYVMKRENVYKNWV